MNLRVVLNFALTADGKISTRQSSPARFTSKHDLDRLHSHRQAADAILVGRGTLEADQMSLTTHGQHQPLRCVVSKSGDFDFTHKLFHSPGGDIHLINTGANQIEHDSATIHHCSLSTWLNWLDRQPGINTLLCEGGGTLASHLFALNHVDEINITIATHTVFGGHEAPTLTGKLTGFLPKSRHFDLQTIEPGAHGEFFLHYLRREGASHCM
ncbi:MAG: RibD family protein [Verrucomicrobiaceae bacterium]